jgi:tRNA pseudouridine38-40 synthase
MRRIRCIVEYDGTRYVGWQVQPNGVSIQQRINEALFALTSESEIQAHGSGRTDSGVHAYAQVFHFDTLARIPGEKFAYALNAHLPRDIRVLWSEDAPDGFHARFSAKEKTYRYVVQTGPHARVFSSRTSLHIHTPLEDGAMEAAAAAVLGEHDFSAFMCAGSPMESTVRSVYQSQWIREGAYLIYEVTGNGFLYNMVRILVGTMLDIGMGRRPVDAMDKALDSGLRGDAGPTAPAHGLALMRVKYEDFDTMEVLSRL